MRTELLVRCLKSGPVYPTARGRPLSLTQRKSFSAIELNVEPIWHLGGCASARAAEPHPDAFSGVHNAALSSSMLHQGPCIFVIASARPWSRRAMPLRDVGSRRRALGGYNARSGGSSCCGPGSSWRLVSPRNVVNHFNHFNHFNLHLLTAA